MKYKLTHNYIHRNQAQTYKLEHLPAQFKYIMLSSGYLLEEKKHNKSKEMENQL